MNNTVKLVMPDKIWIMFAVNTKKVTSFTKSGYIICSHFRSLPTNSLSFYAIHFFTKGMYMKRISTLLFSIAIAYLLVQRLA